MTPMPNRSGNRVVYKGSIINEKHVVDRVLMDASGQVLRNDALWDRGKDKSIGFFWGNSGMGSWGLALSILYDFLGHEPDAAMVQQFKWDKVATLPIGMNWQMGADEIETWHADITGRGQDDVREIG